MKLRARAPALAGVVAVTLLVLSGTPAAVRATSHVSISEKVTTSDSQEASRVTYKFHVDEGQSETRWFENYQWDPTPRWYRDANSSTEDNSGSHPWRVTIDCYGNHAEPSTELDLNGEGDLNESAQLYLDEITISYDGSYPAATSVVAAAPAHGFQFVVPSQPAGGSYSPVYTFRNTDDSVTITLDSLRIYRESNRRSIAEQWSGLGTTFGSLLLSRLAATAVPPGTGDAHTLTSLPLHNGTDVGHIYVAGFMSYTMPGMSVPVRHGFRHGIQEPYDLVHVAGEPPRAPGVSLRVTGGAIAARNIGVEFAGPVNSPARLAVFDLQGRRVAPLYEGPLGTGLHRAVWNGQAANGRPAAEGLYVIRFEIPTAVRCVRVVRAR